MAKDTIVYELINSDSVVYIGTTNDPGRRQREHQEKGWVFNYLNPVTDLMTAADAMVEEKKRLQEYKRTHGRLPQYNTDPSG